MKWEDIRLLAVVTRHGSISAAARHEGASIATVARRIAALERQLGVLLLHRGREGARPTDHGAALVRASARAQDAIGEIERIALSWKAHGGKTLVRVSTTEPVIAAVLAPAVARLWNSAPELHLSMSSSNDIVSLAAGEADIAVRLAKPEGNSLIVRRIATMRFGLYASPGYLSGRPAGSIDLRQERLLGYDDSFGDIEEVNWFKTNGLSQQLALRTSSTLGLIAATRAGGGISMLPSYFSSDPVKLIEIPVLRPIPPRSIWLMWHRSLARDVKVRAVREWITKAFANVR